jgi:hypothetical protein
MNALVIIATMVLAVGVALLLSAGVRFYSEHLRRETHRAEAACAALRHHREAVDSIVNQPDLSPAMERFVLRFAEMVICRASANRVMGYLASGMTLEIEDDEESRHIDQAIHEFTKRNAACADMLSVAIRSGLVAMILQWPETSKRMELLMAELAAETAPEVMQTARKVHRAHGRGDFLGGGGGVPLPA